MATEILGTMLDLVILALPTRGVWVLQMSNRTKVVLTLIFLLGGLYVHFSPKYYVRKTNYYSVVITNPVRLYIVLDNAGTYSDSRLSLIPIEY